MERRKFIRDSFFVSGGLILSSTILGQESAIAPRRSKKITILHTNDTHSNIDPFPINHAKFPNRGGVEKRFELIQQIRKDEEHVLVLDAGDIFQGTPYFNKYGGVLEMKLMTAMGYDASTMGNHDFDGGLDGFLKAKQFAKFPFLCANYNFENTILDQQTKPNVIIEKGGLKIGIFGIGIELDGLVPRGKYQETVFLDPIETAIDQAEELNKKGCDLIICLSHLGYEYATTKISDRVLARKTKNIHLIIGGHTHTFLEKPTVEINSEGKNVLINQVGWGGINLGRIDFEIDSKLFSNRDIIQV